ncbi:globin domain-containing protein [Halarcobacter anaerophilus]|jgi:hemoglobin|uniref:Globin n=1 Tax=Halarcobacter anaerophilus TaxID=877500 RepID=A0A4Q0Y3D2_9BACT|nr:globin [Halarcobacter anaerophilus]QDF29395.1 globin [Halarcobacter anaerophilus]RXJ64640.1 globin [Halarcobacter anaerophilus]
MEYKITKTKFGERPDYELPKPIFLEEMGEEGLVKLFDKFYDLLADSDIGNFFPQDEEELKKVKAHNVKFFIEACGGENYYSQTVGHFDMIKAHEPFSITEKARTEWLGCMEEVLKEFDISDEAKQSFWEYLETFSKHTVNVDTGLKLPEDIVKI